MWIRKCDFDADNFAQSRDAFRRPQTRSNTQYGCVWGDVARPAFPWGHDLSSRRRLAWPLAIS